MSTLGSLMSLLGETGIKPYNEQELTENRIRGGQISNQTGLLELAALRRQQETAAQARAYFAANPQALFGDQQVPQSTLGSLAPAGGGPLTQQTTVPGQPPGVPQMVPGGQDLSRFAGGLGTDPGGPPQSTLGSLAPQPQANPLMDLMRLSPDAAFAVMQRQQSQQDLALKRDEQRLGVGTKIAEYVGRIAQGVTDQASLDAARQELARVHPQAAAQLPQTYSKEAMAPFIAKANSVLENQTLQVGEMKAQIEARKLQMQAANIPNYTGDANLDAAIYERMKAQPPGTMPPADVVAAARKDVQEGKVTVSESQGAAASQNRAMGETMQKRLEAFDKAGMAGQETHTVLDEAERLIAEGVYGNSPIDRANMLAYNKGLAPGDTQAQRTKRLMELGAQLKLAHGSLGSGVSTADAVTYGKAAGNFEEPKNVAEMQQSITSMRSIANTAMRRANEARKSAETTGRLPEFEERGAGASQGGGKVVSEADIAATMQASGKTRQQVLDALKAKGYTVR